MTLIEITRIKVINNNIFTFSFTFSNPCVYLISTVFTDIGGGICYKAWQIFAFHISKKSS